MRDLFARTAASGVGQEVDGEHSGPFSNLRFLVIEANCLCIDAEFRIDQNGTLSASVCLSGLGGPGNVPVDLTTYPRITRLEIVNRLNDVRGRDFAPWARDFAPWGRVFAPCAAARWIRPRSSKAPRHGKRVWASGALRVGGAGAIGHGDALAGRRPLPSLRLSGVLPLRFDERAFAASFQWLPPRSTRVPSGGNPLPSSLKKITRRRRSAPGTAWGASLRRRSMSLARKRPGGHAGLARASREVRVCDGVASREPRSASASKKKRDCRCAPAARRRCRLRTCSGLPPGNGVFQALGWVKW